MPPVATRIYLTGFMGSGKSTVGPPLAQALGYRFVDLDEEIERRAGTSIVEIFANEGEEGFRRRESEALAAVSVWDDVVVALGGGVMTRAENRGVLARSGVVFFLQASPGELLRRLRPDAARRPLLQDEGGRVLPLAAMRARIERMLAERLAAYRRADHEVSTEGLTVAEAVSTILHLLRSVDP